MRKELDYTQKYSLYLSILRKYKLEFFDEQINCNDYFVFIDSDYYCEFDNVEKLQQLVFDCVLELNKYTIELNNFFVTYRMIDNDCDFIILTSARNIYEYVRDEMQ